MYVDGARISPEIEHVIRVLHRRMRTLGTAEMRRKDASARVNTTVPEKEKVSNRQTDRTDYIQVKTYYYCTVDFFLLLFRR